MITHVQAKSGFAAELANLKDRKFEFGPGVTVLFGPNGCGKTTILKLAAGHTGIDTSNRMMGGGWNRCPKFIFEDKPKFPAQFVENTVGKCKADVGWDGSGCFYNSAGLGEASVNMGQFVDSEDESPDGLMGFEEQIGLCQGHFSEGELRNHKIFKVVEALKKPPKLEANKHSRDAQKAYLKYVETLPRDGRVTLLWDEPDRSLSIESQINFWSRFVLSFSRQENVQVIISSHSMVLLHMPKCVKDFTLIDVEANYLEKSKKQLEDLMGVVKNLEEKAQEKADAPQTTPAKVRRTKS